MIRQKLNSLPTDPGCYLMKNKAGEIIYVGKAKNLKNRVSSYFTGAHDYKTTKLISLIHDFDIIVTKTEKESLILEINLIKEHRPRFNILFMDDKSYPYLKINKKGIPVVVVNRDRKHSEKFIYFGPYPNATAARNMAALLNESMPTEAGFYPNKQKIYTILNKTEKELSSEEIETWRQSMIKVLKGQDHEFKAALIKKMNEASAELNFEVAQIYKDKLEGLEYISDRQQVQFKSHENFDMFNYAESDGYVAIVGLFVRAGRLLEKTMALESILGSSEDAFVSFIAQFYENQPLAKDIIVPQSIDIEDLSTLLSTPVRHVFRGKKRNLLKIGYRNAQIELEEHVDRLALKEKRIDASLFDLASILSINSHLYRIEMFDNSHISGSFSVSACVVFDEGLPNKKEYRRYRLSTGADDVASMKEVIYRRYFRILKERKGLPDLILVDGGITQLRAAKEVINDLELDVPVAALIKDDRHKTRALLTEDEIEIKIENEAVLSLLVQMQEEVHRFVVAYHRLLRKKAMTRSILDEVDGLGPVGQKKLYKTFGSIKNMRKASLASLNEVLQKDVAKRLYELLHIDWNEIHEKN